LILPQAVTLLLKIHIKTNEFSGFSVFYKIIFNLESSSGSSTFSCHLFHLLKTNLKMISQKPLVKSYVNETDDDATIICPDCKAAKTISVKQFRDNQHVVKVKCKCGYIFKVQLEFRVYYRKEIVLPATYDLDPPAVGGGSVEIVNLSLGGACFEISGVHDIKVGLKGSINFTLDDNKQTVFFKNVIIRSIHENRIGCEFIEDQAYQKDLGFYLRT